MNKSLLALAVAAALPTLAQAQTTVTVSGIIKTGVQSVKLSNAAVAADNGNSMAVNDGSSRFIIAGSEDLGGGLRATFQVDTRLRPDEGTGTVASGNSWVGLAGGFGQIRLGRLDQYYGLGVDQHSARATALTASNISILSYIGGATGVTAAAVANASRTSNLIRWDSANIAGFTAGLGYSTAYATAEGGVGAPGKGAALAADLAYAAGPLTAGLNYWDAKDEPKANGQKGLRVGASMNVAMLNVGLAIDQSSISTGLGTATSVENKRTAYSIPVRMSLGAGTLMVTYSVAQNIKANGSTVSNSGAKFITAGYDYPLSKRTSIGLSYANMNNDSGAAYALFTGAALHNIPAPKVGQDTQQIHLGLRHAF